MVLLNQNFKHVSEHVFFKYLMISLLFTCTAIHTFGNIKFENQYHDTQTS